MFVRWAILAVVPLVAAFAASTQPSIIVIVADQLRYQSVGYAGDTKARTPNLDRLASEGVSFRNFVANTPVCAATRASLLTGKYSSSTGMVVNELRLNPNHDSFAHVLNRAGYRSALIGKWHLWANDSRHPLIADQFVPPGPYRLGFDDYWAGFNFWHFNYRAFYFTDTDEPHVIDGYGPEHFTTLTIDYLRRKVAAREPFNVLFALSPPHDPWDENNVPRAWLDRFANTEFSFPSTWQDTPDPRMDRNADPRYWLQFWKPHLLDFMRVYYAMTASLDEQVGRILAEIDRLGINRDTIVVFTSDHGEMFGAHGRIWKMTFYDESARVPFLVRWPGHVPAGLISDAPMSTVDIMPTLLGLAGQPIPRGVEGVNLSSVARGKPGPEPEFALLQGMGHTYQWQDGFEWRALRDRRYTYARYLKDGKELLFDNQSDPTQARDLASDPAHAAMLDELRRKMNSRMKELGDDFHTCSWYRDQWTDNRVILRGGRGPFHRELGKDSAVDVHYRSKLTDDVLPLDYGRN